MARLLAKTRSALSVLSSRGFTFTVGPTRPPTSPSIERYTHVISLFFASPFFSGLFRLAELLPLSNDGLDKKPIRHGDSLANARKDGEIKRVMVTPTSCDRLRLVGRPIVMRPASRTQYVNTLLSLFSGAPSRG